MTQALDQLDPLDDFDKRTLTFGDDEDAAKSVYVAGSGPAVIVMTEMPCITPYVARFARWVRDAGFTVWMPSLFGPDGAVPTMDIAMEIAALPCMRREFTSFAEGRPSPMVTWLRQLSAHAHAACGGPGVGAIGMCFTGNFALGMMLEPSMLAPVMSQPSPAVKDSASTGIRDADMVTIRRRLDHENLTVLAYRFAGDTYCKAERFESFDRALGDRLVARTLPDSAAAPGGWTGVPHSVVTTELVDEVGEPTIAARDEILQFFAARLQPSAD